MTILRKDFWLLIPIKRNRVGSHTNIELQKPEIKVKRPNTGRNSIAVEVKLAIPDSIFREPNYKAQISIGEEMVVPEDVDLETVSHIEKIVKDQTGIVLEIAIPEKDGEQND